MPDGHAHRDETRTVASGRVGRVLVADDDPILREIAGQKLSVLGFDVDMAADGHQAWAMLSEGGHDLALIDLGMPGLDGFQVIERVRSDSTLKHLPVVVITGRDDVTAVDRAFAMGATAFVTKPVHWQLFAHQVRYVLKGAQQEADLRAAQARDAVASKRKDDLLAVITHELRTPIHVISGFADLLSRETDGPIGRPSYKSYADQIATATHDLDTLLSDLILYSRAIARSLEVADGDWPVKKLFDDVVEKLEPRALQRGVRLEVRVGPDEVCVDRKLIGRALAALVDNAIKFAPRDTMVRVAGERGPEGYVLKVSDEGAGIPEAMARSVFEPFAQVDMSHARPANGLGIGLTLVKAIAEAHGGAAHVTTFAPKGAVVQIELPIFRVLEP
jgi:signal transduction histidine kinase